MDALPERAGPGNIGQQRGTAHRAIRPSRCMLPPILAEFRVNYGDAATKPLNLEMSCLRINLPDARGKRQLLN